MAENTMMNPGIAAQQARAIVNPDGVKRLGAMLSKRFTQYETDRRLAELKWARNARQYLGIYDPDVDLKMDPNRSRAYPKVTRVKCVSMLSRLMNLMFPTSDKCWGISPSAVPDLDQQDLQQVLDQVMQQSQQEGQNTAPTDDQIEEAIRIFAAKRADRLELEVEDQLQDLGGSRMLDFVALCRKVMASGIQYGMGILKGPHVEEVQRRRWSMDATGRLQPIPITAYRPRFEFVPIWEFYPDMSAKSLTQMDGQFQRVVMSKHQVAMLAQRPDFLQKQVEEFLAASPSGNYKRKPFETDLKAMGVQVNVTESERNKYEAQIWYGYVSGKELADAGADIAPEQLTQDVQAEIWLLGDMVVKADLDPWTTLETDGEVPRYHFFIFEEDESSLLGNGLPNIVRDSQMGICAATRMVMDNGSVQRNLEINTELLTLGQDTTSITTDKIWYRNDTNPATISTPAVRRVELDMHLPEMQAIVKMFQEFADQETFVGAATGGDLQKGPSEPFRTAAGASMLKGDAALPFKDVVRNFDIFVESVIGALINFNRNFNSNPDIKGDFKPVARGATSLIAKEVLGIQLDNLAVTLTEDEKLYINMHELAKARVRVRDMEIDKLVVDDDEAARREQAQSQKQQQMDAQQSRAIEAQIREQLATALNKLAQAGKNAAAQDATTANVILSALEKGINPNELTNNEQPAGGGGLGAESAGGPGGAGNTGIPETPPATTGENRQAAAGMPAARVSDFAGQSPAA